MTLRKCVTKVGVVLINKKEKWIKEKMNENMKEEKRTRLSVC